MRISAVADVHLGSPRRMGGPVHVGVNARGREALDVLSRAVFRVVVARPDVFVVCGDLFDTTSPPPQLLARVQEILGAAVDGGVPTVVIPGNHDQVSDAEGDNALRPLRPAGVRVVDVWNADPGDQVASGVLLAPFKREPVAEWLPSFLSKYAGSGARILCLHAVIIDASTPVFLRNSPDAVEARVLGRMCAEYGIRAVVCGNWHKRGRWRESGVEIVQVGALVPTGFDNQGVFDEAQAPLYGALAHGSVEEPGVRVVHESIPGPRFVTGFRSAARWKALADWFAARPGYSLYAEHSGPDADGSVRALFEQEKSAERIAGWAIVPRRATISYGASENSRGQPTAYSLDAAVESVIAGQGWDGPLKRDVRALLAGGAKCAS